MKIIESKDIQKTFRTSAQSFSLPMIHILGIALTLLWLPG